MNAKYEEVASIKISDTRNIVISKCSKGGFTVAQQLVAKEGNVETNIFMKGAFHVADIKGLCNMRDALDEAISRLDAHPATFKVGCPPSYSVAEDEDWGSYDWGR